MPCHANIAQALVAKALKFSSSLFRITFSIQSKLPRTFPCGGKHEKFLSHGDVR